MIKAKAILIIIFVGLAYMVQAQQYSQMGVQGGGAYYIGELNQGTPFYRIQPMYGILFRRNFNPHYSLQPR